MITCVLTVRELSHLDVVRRPEGWDSLGRVRIDQSDQLVSGGHWGDCCTGSTRSCQIIPITSNGRLLCAYNMQISVVAQLLQEAAPGSAAYVPHLHGRQKD